MRITRQLCGTVLASAVLLACSGGGSGPSQAPSSAGDDRSSPASDGSDDATGALSLPDEDGVKQVFGADANLHPIDVDPTGTVGAACSGDPLDFTGRNSAVAVTPDGPVQMILYVFGAEGDAAAWFDSYATGRVGCIWTGPDIETLRSLDSLVPLDDLGGARRVEAAQTLTITVSGQSPTPNQTQFVLMQRGPTVAWLQTAVGTSVDSMLDTFDTVGRLVAA